MGALFNVHEGYSFISLWGLFVWSRKYSKCVQCKSDAFKHMAKGLCSSCYAKRYKSDPVKKLRVDQQKKEWFQKNHAEILKRFKSQRNARNFDGRRDEVLKRDNYKCVRCPNTKQLTVHHKDRNGRGKDDPNNCLDNLETLCRSCHAKEHSDELQSARKQAKLNNKT